MSAISSFDVTSLLAQGEADGKIFQVYGRRHHHCIAKAIIFKGDRNFRDHGARDAFIAWRREGHALCGKRFETHFSHRPIRKSSGKYLFQRAQHRVRREAAQRAERAMFHRFAQVAQQFDLVGFAARALCSISHLRQAFHHVA